MNAMTAGLRWDTAGPKGMQVLMIAFDAQGREAAGLAKSLRHAGCIVAALCCDAHILAAAPFLQARFKLETTRSSRAMASRLADVMVRCRPRLVLPCDARARSWLQELVRDWLAGAKCALDGEAMQTLLASLGDPSAYHLTTGRAGMPAIARECGLSAPATVIVASPEHAAAAAVVIGLPVDVVSAGRLSDHRPVRCDQAADVHVAAAQLSSQPHHRSLVERVRQAIVGTVGDQAAPIVVRAVIEGDPLTYSVAALNGVVMAGFATRMLVDEASESVSVEAHGALARAASGLVRRLGASGLLRLDFVVEAVTGDVYLLDCDAWPDALAPLGERAGVDLGGALACGLRGEVPWRRTPDQPVVVDMSRQVSPRDASQGRWPPSGAVVSM